MSPRGEQPRTHEHEGPTLALWRALGPSAFLRVGLALVRRAVADDPFGHLPAAMGRERLSRGQARPAILLYRALRGLVGTSRALEITGRVVEAAALEHLERTLGDFDVSRLAALAPDARAARVRGLLDRFFTATAHVEHVGDDSAAFTVTACALARLSREAGHPELAPVFCRADARFFATRTPPIALDRATTLAEGGPSCPFVLRT